MTITVQAPDELESQILEAATQNHMTVEQYVLHLVRSNLPMRQLGSRTSSLRGKYAAYGPSSMEFMARKAEEKALEERL
jgi:hypothetical protein